MSYLGAAGGPELRAPAAAAAGHAGPAAAGAGQHEAGAGQGEEGGGQVQGAGDSFTCILQTPGPAGDSFAILQTQESPGDSFSFLLQAPGPAGEQGGVTVTTQTSHQDQGGHSQSHQGLPPTLLSQW